jgi:exopolyphosphatase / guanosine-5'-triphosphate,3'-diphosphate pyrophosphatase
LRLHPGQLKIAAIDIGSNAIRFQISSVLDNGQHVLFKKMEYVRFPLRLGHDVFTHGKISKVSATRFVKLMKAYKILLDLYQADAYMFCATSAMRESSNGKALAERVKKEVGVKINIITGQTEAELLNKAILSYLQVDRAYLHIDVGGGSTEFNIYIKGKKIASRSFKLGSVRVLEHHDSPEIWADMQTWLKENVKSAYGKITAVGTGGNISKIYELAQPKSGKSITIRKMKSIREMVSGMDMDTRIYKLQMNPDRADVIVPASDIYIRAMEWAGSGHMIVPEVGLKDGIIYHLFQKNAKRKNIRFVNTRDQGQGKKTTKIS